MTQASQQGQQGQRGQQGRLDLPVKVAGSHGPRHRHLLAGQDEVTGPDEAQEVVPPQVAEARERLVLHLSPCGDLGHS